MQNPHNYYRYCKLTIIIRIISLHSYKDDVSPLRVPGNDEEELLVEDESETQNIEDEVIKEILGRESNRGGGSNRARGSNSGRGSNIGRGSNRGRGSNIGNLGRVRGGRTTNDLNEIDYELGR